MFLTAGEDEEPHAGLKPMNCPGHMLLFGNQLRSYRDLPLRYAESSTLHRNEPTGTLHGLLRVRHVTQDDAHIFCAREQIEDEIFGCLDYAAYLYDLFGMEARFELSTRPDDKLGTDEEWDFTEAALAPRSTGGLAYDSARARAPSTAEDRPAHDGRPRRSWQMGTIQLDAQMPKQFGLTYMGADNPSTRRTSSTARCSARSSASSGILIEHYAGASRLARAGAGARAARCRGARGVARAARGAPRCGRPADGDERDETLGKRIRDAELQKIPYVVVWGDRETREAMAVRRRGGEGVEPMSLDALVDEIRSSGPAG
jgi:threonyl-tRNA synthetase